ncbi:MAG: acylphosphatase [Ignavibacteria bacterium]|nr:acylphosphatase [Ignavibacteria bacterium]
MKLLKIRISGLVQGVGFRYFAYRNAGDLGISGFVRNEYDGSLLIQACGDPEKLEQFCKRMEKGPSRSQVKELLIIETGLCNDEGGFHIE